MLPIGGVLLDKAATLVGQNLSDITGAMYDPVSGQFVFLGTNSPTPVKNINLDYLYTALQAVYGSAQPPFLTLDPSASPYTQWTDLGNGNGIFETGEQGGFTVRYNPIWDQQDTTVDVIIQSTWNATKYSWKARFNCVTNGTVAGASWSWSGGITGGRNMMQMVFSNWVTDANSTIPPSGISLNTNYWTAGTIPNGASYQLTPTSQDSYIPFILANGTTNNYIVTYVMVVPARQHRQFGGRVENTKVGWVMEEADRTMKGLVVGSNNITTAAYNSSTITVPGYSNMVQRLSATGNKNANVRFWFTPNQMTLQRYIDPKTGLASVVFTNSTVLLNTESFMLGLPQAPEAKAFADNFTINYDKFAALTFPCYNPNDPTGQSIIQTNIFGLLKDVMKAVSLARFFRDNNIPVDMWWLNSWQCPVAYTPKSVPTAANVNSASSIICYGGVQVNSPNTYNPSVTASNVAAVVQSSRPDTAGNANGDIQQQIWTNSTSVGSLKAVSVHAKAEPMDGNMNLSEVDLSFASPGGLSLQLTRNYQSSWLGTTAMGRGWRYLPVELQFDRPSWFDENSLMLNASGTPLFKFSTGDTGLRSGTIRVVDLSSGATLDFNSSLILGYAMDNVGNPSIAVSGLTSGVPTFTPGQRQSGATLTQNASDLSYQLTTPDGNSFKFDHEGRLLAAQGKYGRKLNYSYDNANHLQFIMDDAFQMLSFAYDPTTNFIISVSGPAGEQVNYSYTTNGLLAKATHVRSGASVSYQYNTNSQLVGKTLFNGLAVIQAQTDLKGRANTNSDVRGNSLTRAFTQDRAGLVRTNETRDPLITDPQFVSKRRQHDRAGRLLASRGVTGAETSYGYDAGSMLPNTVTMPVAGRPPIKIQRDNFGKPVRISDPGNIGAQDVTAGYDPNTGQLLQTTDEAGRRTLLAYNDKHKVSHIQQTLNGQNVDVGFNYSGSGAISQIVNPLGITAVTINRDFLDRVISVKDATGVTVGYQYDNLGRLWKLTDPRLITPVLYIYDNFDRVTEIRMPSGTNYFYYDPIKGWLISQKDMLGRTTRYDRDPKTGDILQIVQIVPGGTNLVTVMSYDRFGNLASVTPPQSSTISYNYDAIGRQTGEAYTASGIPGAPIALKCNLATNGVATWKTNLIFSWSPPLTPVGVRGYSFALDNMPQNITNTILTNATVNNVTIGTHLFQVKAQGTNGMWGPTADFNLIITWAPGTRPPDAPPGLSCDVTSNGIPTYYTDVVFSWGVPASENGVAGYSYVLNGTLDNVVDTTTTNVSLTAPLGTNTFQVKAKGSNNVWGAVSSFQLITQSEPDWSQAVTFNIGGSPICRDIIYDRIQNMFDAGYIKNKVFNFDAVYKGTMAATLPNLVYYTGTFLTGFVSHPLPIIIRCNFMGAIDGVSGLTQLDNGGNPKYDFVASELRFVRPISNYSSYNSTNISVVPYVFARNNALPSIPNITADQACLLLGSSGTNNGQLFHGMTASYLGANGSPPLYLSGLNQNSGTRANLEKCIGYIGSEVLWATNSAGQYCITNGMSSEASVANIIAANSNSIGYLNLGEYLNISGSASMLSFNGSEFSANNVQNGNYEFWSYVRIISVDTDSRKMSIKDALINALTDPSFQNSPLFLKGFLPLSGMKVNRGGGYGDAGDLINPNIGN